LIAYSIAAAKLSREIERVIVSTDYGEIADIAVSYGAEAPFLRPAEISGDSSRDYGFIRHSLDWMRDNEGYQPEYLIHLRPTTPLRDVEHVDAAIEHMRQANCATALRSVHEMSESTYKTFEIEGEYLKCVGSDSLDIEAANHPRQRYEKTYKGNGYVDVIRSSYVIENEKIHGDRVIAYVTPHAFEVETLDDFEYLEYQVAKNPGIVSRLFD
jgi:N-acylneuraminate cytidylyltransferase